METVTEFSYLIDRINFGGGYEAVVTSRTRIGWLKFRDCQDLLHGQQFPLKMNCIQQLNEISNALWKRGMVLRPECDMDS